MPLPEGQIRFQKVGLRRNAELVFEEVTPLREPAHVMKGRYMLINPFLAVTKDNQLDALLVGNIFILR